MMLNKLSQIFKSSKPTLEQQYLAQHHIQHDPALGYIVDGIVANEMSERLEYFSNRRLKSFDDLKALFFTAMIINEKIDLEIATGRYVARLGNNEQNLRELKHIVQVLGDYYKQFIRDKK